MEKADDLNKIKPTPSQNSSDQQREKSKFQDEIFARKRDSHNEIILLALADNERIQKYQELIQEAGFICIPTQSGDAALEFVLEHRPSLLVMDQELSDLTGVEVFETIITGTPYRIVADTPIIIIARAEDHIPDRTRLFDLGLTAYLVEPLGPRELLTSVHNVLNTNRANYRSRQTSSEITGTEYKYQDLVENAHDLIFAINATGKFIFVNRKLVSVTAQSKLYWIGQDFTVLVVEADRKAVHNELKETFKGHTRNFEMRVSCNDKVVYYSTNLNPIFEDGRIIGAVGIARDIDKRKKLEQEIIELKNFNESIIRSMQSGLITLNLKDEIVFFNSAAEELLKFKAHEVKGRALAEILPEDEVKRLLVAATAPAIAPINREMMLTQRDQEKVHIGFTVTPQLDDSGKRVGTIISFKNLTEIKMMQMELIRMDRLASMGVLASGIAHELRNPLAGIKTMTQSLEEDLDHDDPKQEYLKRIIRQVNRLDELLRTFFSYARPRQPVRKLHRLQDIVREVHALVDNKMIKKNIRFSEEYETNLPLIFVDYDQIQQVLLNLLLNAIDAIDKDGDLKISAISLVTRPHAIDRRRSDFARRAQHKLYVEARVTDTGCGIKMDELKNIFDPFFTTKPNGTGLGLSVVYRIMNEHGGEIRADSIFGKGTTFILLLPTEE